MKNIILFFLLTSFLLCCQPQSFNNQKNISKTDSEYIDKSDSIVDIYFDKYPEQTYIKHELIDLNYDSYDDLIIYFEGNGTGPLMKVKVFLFDKSKYDFIFNAELSKLDNPSFYINDRMITVFYIGNGGGYGCKLEWNNRWDTTEYMIFEPYYYGDSQWMVTIKKYEDKNITTKITDNFQIPDSVILPNKY